MIPTQDDSGTKGRFKRLGRLLASEFGRYRKHMVVATILLGGAASLEVLVIFLIAGIGAALLGGHGHVGIKGHELTVMQATIVMLVLVTVRGLSDITGQVYRYNFVARYERECRVGLMEAFLGAEWSEQAADDSGNVQTITIQYLRVAVAAISTVQDCLISFVSSTVFLIATIAEGGIWTLAIIIGSLALAGLLRPFVSRGHRAGNDMRTSSLAFARLGLELFDMAREVRLFRVRQHASEQVEETARIAAKANRDASLANSALASIQASLVYLLAALGLLILVAVHVSDTLRWVTVVMLVYRGLNNLKTFQGTYASLINAMPSVESMRDNRERWRAVAVPTEGVEHVPPMSSIVFEDVGFQYEAGRAALSNASFTVNRGDAVGLMGPSGSGKSTIVQLLLRLRLPTSGRILVNGVDLATIRPDSWFGNAVLVPQEAQLFTASVLENVTAFNPEITRADALDALRQAHVLDEIEALPDGVDTMLGETGRALSGGQRQRVCIARALATKPDVLVLDEPTSALDLISEEGIRATLEALHGSVTIVIIAHRLSTLRVCDTVMVLQDGHITDFGPRSDLEANSTFFAEAVRLAKLVD